MENSNGGNMGLVGTALGGQRIQINVNEVTNGFNVTLNYVHYVAKTKEEVKQLISDFLDDKNK